LPDITCVLIGVVGPTAGRYFIDITAGRPAKQFVQGEWFVGTAALTSVVYLVCAHWFGLGMYLGTAIAFAVGFGFRLTALWRKWEEPMPRELPPQLLEGEVERVSLKEKMEPGWEPKE